MPIDLGKNCGKLPALDTDLEVGLSYPVLTRPNQVLNDGTILDRY